MGGPLDQLLKWQKKALGVFGSRGRIQGASWSLINPGWVAWKRPSDGVRSDVPRLPD